MHFLETVEPNLLLYSPFGSINRQTPPIQVVWYFINNSYGLGLAILAQWHGMAELSDILGKSQAYPTGWPYSTRPFELEME